MEVQRELQILSHGPGMWKCKLDMMIPRLGKTHTLSSLARGGEVARGGNRDVMEGLEEEDAAYNYSLSQVGRKMEGGKNRERGKKTQYEYVRKRSTTRTKTYRGKGQKNNTIINGTNYRRQYETGEP